MDKTAISFGPFRLFPDRRRLMDGEIQVRLGSRAFDILCALVERAGAAPGRCPAASAQSAGCGHPQIGRAKTMTALLDRLRHERLVTIVSPGGIGKTTLALALAEAMVSADQGGV